MRNLIYLLLLLLSTQAALGAGKYSGNLAEELKKLDKAIASSQQTDLAKAAEADSLIRSLRSAAKNNAPTRELWKRNMEIGNRFLTIRADSSLHFFRKAAALARREADSVQLLRSRIAYLHALAVSGIFTQAESEYKSLCEMNLPPVARKELLISGRKLYSYLIGYTQGDAQIQSHYRNIYLGIDDSLLSILPPSDRLGRFIRAERLVSEGKYREARFILEDLLEKLPENDNLYGMAAYQLAQVLKSQGDDEAFASILARAARSDIMAGVKEGFALPTLAGWLYTNGRTEEAYRYINHALQEAMNGNARMRAVTIAGQLPIIDEAYRSKLTRNHNLLIGLCVLTAMLLILSVILLVMVVRKEKRLRTDSEKLRGAARLKDSYIANFLELSSSYADRMEALKKMITRKINAGQSSELVKIMESGRFADAQDDQLFRSFDSAFLDIYPQFIVEINKLLRDEEQITLKPGQILSPELRIYALMRLGIAESTRIAQILHYSANTVYAYRNRMRNRAIDRENFEKNVVMMNSFD